MNFLNRFQYAKTTYLSALIIVLILLAVNVIGLRHFMRVDLTKNQFFALSDGAKDIVRDLDDIVNVKVYFSNSLPPDLFTVRQYLDDILAELNSYSKGNLRIDYFNPDERPEVAEEAVDLGIPQIQMNLVEKDKIEVKNGFLGVAISYGDQTEVLPVVQNVLNIEYDLVSAIKKVTATEPRVVGFVVGHGEPNLDSNVSLTQVDEESLARLRKEMERNYEVREVRLSDPGILNEVNTLMIVGPTEPFTDDERDALDDYLNGGGDVVAFINTMGVTPELVTESIDLNLLDLLADHGIEIAQDQLVLDVSNERVSFNNGYINFLVAYPYWIKAVNQFFNQEHPVVSKLNSLVFMWASPLTVIESEDTISTVLIRSSDQAWSLKTAAGMSLQPDAVQAPASRDQFDLAAMVTRGESRLLAVGNARFVTDAVLQQYPDNLSFVMNAVDYLTLDDSLINIRSKRSFDMPLKELTLNQRLFVKWVGTLLMPLLVVTYGVFRFLKRRKLISQR